MNEAAIKDCLKSIATEKGVSFNEVWKQFLLERFLARLSESKHQEQFIFKGGLLLAQYLEIGRETTDADFLIQKLKSEPAAIEQAMREILATVFEDGFSFSWDKIEELTHPHMKYPGYRVSLHAVFGKMKDKIQLDIGVGDLVDPVSENFHPFECKGKPIFAGKISLLMYPVETIFAEKLETIMSKGSTNSRMKDYHDLILMIRETDLLSDSKFKKSVAATFSNRGTTLKIPIEFDGDGIATLQGLWTNHLRGLGRFKEKLKLPDEINGVLRELNAWMKHKI